MIQTIIILTVVAAALGYASYRVWLAFSRAGDPCYGCKGCELREQMRRQARGKHRPPTCRQRS